LALISQSGLQNGTIPYLLALKGLAFAKLRNYNEWRELSSKAIRLDPSNPTLYEIRSEALAIFKKNGGFTKAFENGNTN
jgi:hypothetical protein